MNLMMNLSELEIGKDAVIESVDCSEISLRKHILDMGLTPGTEISLIKIAPMGDPMEIRVRGYELTLRKDDASYIKIKNIHEAHKIEECKYNDDEYLKKVNFAICCISKSGTTTETSISFRILKKLF